MHPALWPLLKLALPCDLAFLMACPSKAHVLNIWCPGGGGTLGGSVNSRWGLSGGRGGWVGVSLAGSQIQLLLALPFASCLP